MQPLEKIIAHALVGIATGLSIASSAAGQDHDAIRSTLAATSCAPSWLPAFGTSQDVGSRVDCLAVLDDGSGPLLYAGGDFLNAGPVTATRIAKWNGATWAPLGSGMNAEVQALAAFDDGTGPAIYAGGVFTTAGGVVVNRIAKWDGATWSALGSGLNDRVWALAVFDDGTGPALYAGGDFFTAGGVTAGFIAKWNGASWAPVGGGMNGRVHALTVFDDGTGPALYAGGGFRTAGGRSAQGIAKWNGSTWSALGHGVVGGFISTAVEAIAAFDDGSGPALYAGGNFTQAGVVTANYIAKWNGTSWVSLGSGLNTTSIDEVQALAAFDGGTGPALYAGGRFTTAGSVTASNIARWDGATWTPVGDANNRVAAFAVFDNGSGPALYAGGGFSKIGDVGATCAKWNGATWSALGSGIDSSVAALTVFDDGTGPALYAAGSFVGVNGLTLSYVGKWNGVSWAPLGSGTDASINALAVFDDGTGPALYAGGDFTTAGGVAANHIAKWNGVTWAPLGSGLTSVVYALTVFDDGAGPALYAGGLFTGAGGVTANRIAKWNGTTWTRLAGGLDNVVYALTVFDDGTGPALYAGGFFTRSGTISVSRIAKWNGASWTRLGSGVTGASATVSALEVFDDGSGPALYAAGTFDKAGGVAAIDIAKWNGTTWSPLGLGISGWVGALASVHALEVFDDGSGPALYVGGLFPAAAGNPAASDIAKWDGVTWSPLGTGIAVPNPPPLLLDPRVDALLGFDDGSGPALFVGGTFVASPAGDSYLAKWGCLPAGARAYGASSPGCTGPLAIGVTSSPNIGNAAFAITCTNAPPSAPGVFLAGTALSSPVPIQGVQIWVSPIFAPIFGSDPTGHATVPLAIPPSPVFIGAQFDAQLVFLGPNTPPPCPPSAWSASNALELTIQP